MRQLGQRFVSGVSWNLAGAVFNQGSTFVLGMIVANALGRQLYGVFGFLQSTMLLFASMGNLAMGFVTAKFVAEYRTAQKERAGRVIATCLAVAASSGTLATLIAVVIAPLVAHRVVNQPGVEGLIRIAAPGILFTIITSACTGVLVGFENFRRNAIGGVISGSVYLALGALMAQRGTVAAVIGSIVVSAAIQAVVMIVLVLGAARRQEVVVRWPTVAGIREERSSLLHVALPAALSSFSTLPAQWLALSILARGPAGLDQVALFTAAHAIRSMVVFLPYLINNVGLSVLNNYRGSSDTAGYRRAFWMNMAAVVAVAAAGALFVIVAGPLLLRGYGKTFAGAYPVLLIMIGGTIAESTGIAAFQVVQTRGQIWHSFFLVALPRDLSIVLLAYPLTQRFGAAGLAGAYLTGTTIMLLSVVLLVRRLGIAPHATG
jgi:O-antigen/teichoic acid export membrane protein